MAGGGSSGGAPLPIYATFAASATAASFAEVTTLPLDTAKVRLQLQSSAAAGAKPKYSGLLGTCATVAKEEGAGALWKGVIPGVHRQCLFGGLRIGLYDPVKAFYCGPDHVGDVPLHLKIAAGLTTGAVGIAIANPTDFVKVRLQSQGRPGVPIKYTQGAVAAYSQIIKEEGVATLWRGVGANMTRNAVINAAELASYDQIKEGLLASGLFQDDVKCHIASGLGAGFVACCVGSPVDVVKSRVMGDTTGMYKGTVDCFMKTLASDGPLAFYKGFGPNFARLGSWNVCMFLTLEQIKKAIAPHFNKE